MIRQVLLLCDGAQLTLVLGGCHDNTALGVWNREIFFPLCSAVDHRHEAGRRDELQREAPLPQHPDAMTAL